MFTDLNGVYEKQLNVYVAIGDVLMGNVPFFTFNDIPTNDDIGGRTCKLQGDTTDQLNKMTAWASSWYDFKSNNCTAHENTTDDCSSMDRNAAWILLSACGRGGTAWIRTLCRKFSQNEFEVQEWSHSIFVTIEKNKQLVQSVFIKKKKKNRGGYAAGVVNYNYQNTWYILAHEVGHIFGAKDSFENGSSKTGGIMDYGGGVYKDTYQFHPFRKAELCSAVGHVAILFTPRLIYIRILLTLRLLTFFLVTFNYGPIKKIDSTGRTYVTNDSDCKRIAKPQSKIIECDSKKYPCPDSTCGNALWETNEECESHLDPQCCHRNCTRVKSSECNARNPQIDCAFIDSYGHLYLFQQQQFAKYSKGLEQTFPDEGYPQSIVSAFPLHAWTDHLDACFATSQDIAYFFKNFSFVRVDLSKPWSQAQFLNCGHIDAAFMISDIDVILVCQSIYYQFALGNLGGIRLTRPFWQDYPIQFSAYLRHRYVIDAAVGDSRTGKVRFYLGDEYVDYRYDQQLSGTPKKHVPMGYPNLTSSLCTDSNCVYCDTIMRSCTACKVGYTLQSGKVYCIRTFYHLYVRIFFKKMFPNRCYDTSYLVVLHFNGSGSKYEEYIDLQESVFEYNSSIVETGSEGSLYLQPAFMVILFPPDLSMFANDTILQFTYTLDIYPEYTIHIADQALFTIVNTDMSRCILQLQPNPKQKKKKRGKKSLIISIDDTLFFFFFFLRAAFAARLIKRFKKKSYIFDDDNCGTSIQYLQWSKITVHISMDFVKVTVNGYSQTVPVSLHSQFDLSTDISQWFLGNGFVGFVDSFIFQVTQQMDATPNITAGSAILSRSRSTLLTSSFLVCRLLAPFFVSDGREKKKKLGIYCYCFVVLVVSRYAGNYCTSSFYENTMQLSNAQSTSPVPSENLSSRRTQRSPKNPSYHDVNGNSVKVICLHDDYNQEQKNLLKPLRIETRT
ncbi:hypothetical protein RFI_05263 [Reticulomyxa filosa]|uniref:Peptidase M12B domain-containing protein n=1 Tax=Reticulomyxa filosa TaxID=46433 RepID=X6P2S1_RETFI|nr:hypothetical protein RFI_05263 [Reticulomyxa filosa]|eukprot:ETO31857.1 hypothetical protein RFI_05263 [Reticulomyxa filosa]